jgi:hypothetical protein
VLQTQGRSCKAIKIIALHEQLTLTNRNSKKRPSIFIRIVKILFFPKKFYFSPKNSIFLRKILFFSENFYFSPKNSIFLRKILFFSEKFYFSPKKLYFSPKKFYFSPKNSIFLRKILFFSVKNSIIIRVKIKGNLRDPKKSEKDMQY